MAYYNNVALSKELVRILRHGKYGLSMDSNGYVSVDEIIPALSGHFGKVSLDDIKMLISKDDKKRFELKEVYSKWMVKATQGHTVQVLDLGLTEITDPRKYETIIHGTHSSKLPSIQESGLSRMKRTHIHFAMGLPGDPNVISGMPKGCNVIIYIDMFNAMKDGIKFYESSNRVVLTEGDKYGCIPPKYFKKIIRL